MAREPLEDVLIDAESVAQLLEIELTELYRETFAGHVPSVVIDGRNLYHPAVLTRWINRFLAGTSRNRNT